jgi:hypothetical protein
MIPGKWLVETATAQLTDPRPGGHGSEIPGRGSLTRWAAGLTLCCVLVWALGVPRVRFPSPVGSSSPATKVDDLTGLDFLRDKAGAGRAKQQLHIWLASKPRPRQRQQRVVLVLTSQS